jgi:Zn-dependent M28 family amino/carboxypeptidase
MRVPLQNADGSKKGTFAFVLSPREGQRLRRELASSKTPIRVSAKIDADFTEAPFQSFVEAVIRGTDIHDQDIVLTGHIQEERFSANDDGSGLANVLEIGRALKKAIDEGRLPRPRRDIRFWWCDEIGGEEQFFANFPDERKQILANINQDMVGALQSAGSRVQFVSREPWSRASFLGDVVESILMALVAGNTGYLSPGQVPANGMPADGMPVPGLSYTRPILSPLGTHERFDARMIPFHNNTDSQVFNLGVVGVPAVTFTNWPDDFIHSTGDDLWQVDATQLERNAVAIAGMSWFLATAGDAQAPLLATHVYGRALERMSRDARLAMEMIEAALPASSDVLSSNFGKELGEATARGSRLVREAARRERRALESVRAFVAPGSRGAKAVDAVLAQLPTAANAEERLRTYLRSLVQTYGMPPASEIGNGVIGGGLVSSPDVPVPIADRVPVMTDSVKAFLELRGKVERPRTLHPLMQYEALNFADGKRTVLEISNAVAAEADSAGAWYYGTVAQADIEKVFESAAQAGLVKWGRE